MNKVLICSALEIKTCFRTIPSIPYKFLSEATKHILEQTYYNKELDTKKEPQLSTVSVYKPPWCPRGEVPYTKCRGLLTQLLSCKHFLSHRLPCQGHLLIWQPDFLSYLYNCFTFHCSLQNLVQMTVNTIFPCPLL